MPGELTNERPDRPHAQRAVKSIGLERKETGETKKNLLLDLCDDAATVADRTNASSETHARSPDTGQAA